MYRLTSPGQFSVELLAMTYKQAMYHFRRRRLKIKALLAKGLKPATVARRIGISRQRVHQISKGRT